MTRYGLRAGVLAGALMLLPVVLYAQNPAPQGLVPCDGPDCNFASLVQLGQIIINWLVYISVIVAAVLFGWAGVKYVTAGGDPGKIKEARDIIRKTLIGFLFVIGAWLIVYTITEALGLKTDYTLLE